MQRLVGGFGEFREQCPSPSHLHQDFDISHRARLWTLPPQSVNFNALVFCFVLFVFFGITTVFFHKIFLFLQSVLLLVKEEFRFTSSLFQCTEETWCRSVLAVEEVGVSLQQGLSRFALSAA